MHTLSLGKVVVPIREEMQYERCGYSGVRAGLYSRQPAHILLSQEALWKSVNSNSVRLRAQRGWWETATTAAVDWGWSIYLLLQTFLGWSLDLLREEVKLPLC